MAAFNAILPPTWSHNNPVDIIGDAGAELYAKAVDIAAKDPNTDGMLVILTPQAMTDATATAEQLKPYAQAGGQTDHRQLDGGRTRSRRARTSSTPRNIPTFKYPDRAARAFCYMWRYSENLRALYETPARGRIGRRRHCPPRKADSHCRPSRKAGAPF